MLIKVIGAQSGFVVVVMKVTMFMKNVLAVAVVFVIPQMAGVSGHLIMTNKRIFVSVEPMEGWNASVATVRR